MTDADNRMHPHFRTDPTDVQIRINTAIQIRILDDLWLKIWHWRRFALSECSRFCVFVYKQMYFIHYVQGNTVAVQKSRRAHARSWHITITITSRRECAMPSRHARAPTLSWVTGCLWPSYWKHPAVWSLSNKATVPKMHRKNAVFSETKHWQHIGSPTWAFQRSYYWTHKIQDGRDPCIV